MAAAPQNFPNKGNTFSNLTKPITIDLNFVVDSSNGNGLGIRSLKSNGYVKSVFMQTSATPATGNPFVNSTSAGYAIIQLQGNFNRYIGGFTGFVSPLTGSTIKVDNGATLTIGLPYVIAILGNATAAQWKTLGVPTGVTPAVGLTFIAAATGAGSGNTSTTRVELASVSSIMSVEVIGDVNQTNNSSTSANGGMYVVIQFLAPTVSGSAYDTPMIPTAPANGSVVGMRINLDGSSVTVDGQ